MNCNLVFNRKIKIKFMENSLVKRNQNLINTIFIATLLFIFLYDNRVEFFNGVLAGLNDFVK
ncbi:hypothetical protein QF042_001192 [Pedobacter sp. W3I1]|nr:hypothetical protein [Pedobacter sp. W3I1]